jgi:hypothetical protein
LDILKEQTAKAQERERRFQEEKRLHLEKEKEKQDESLRFHRIKAVALPPQAKPKVEVIARPASVSSPLPPVSAVVVPHPAVVVKELKPDSNVKPEEDALDKQRKHQKELRAQREKDRQDRLKAQQEAKAAFAKAKEEKLAKERKHREEILRQQEQERQERIKKEEIIRQEDQRRQGLQRQERERQAQLEARRLALRKRLEEGVEAMYQEALGLYKQGEYTAAADRFKDVQDIIPGYKRSGKYMDEARVKSLGRNLQEVPASDMSLDSKNHPVSSAGGVGSKSVSNQDNVSKALDLFDPNAK